MNAGTSNLRVAVKLALADHRAGRLDEDELVDLLDVLFATYAERGTVPVSGAIFNAPWYSRWEEHRNKIKKQQRRAADPAHLMAGMNPLPIEADPRRGLSTMLQPASEDEGYEPVEGAQAKLELLLDLQRALNVPCAICASRRFTSYRLRRVLVYVASPDGQTHWTTTLHWEDYLKLRRTRPEVVVIVDQAHELVQAMIDQGVLA